jgi:membrane fusion protein (multidrug efflux system)
VKRPCLPFLAAVCAWAGLFPPTTVLAQGGFPPSPVIVSEVQQRTIVGHVELVGTVHPRRVSQLASETEGKVVARFKEPGQTLKRGEAILRLANTRLQAQLIEAEADLRLRTFRRDRGRSLRDSDAISEDEAIETEYEFDRARSELQDLQGRIDHMTIRAPFDGALVESLVEIGEWVDRGQSVAHVVAADTARVYVDVPERYVDRLRHGDDVAVTVTALGTDVIVAVIVAILPQGFEDSRTFPVIVQFLNPGRRVRGGMSATVRFTISESHEDLLVHKDAIITSATGSHLFVVREDAAVMQPVTTGLASQGSVAIHGDGLQPGDLVIVRGNERLRDGQAVRVVRKLQ